MVLLLRIQRSLSSPLRSLTRPYSSTSNLPPLPPLAEWKKIFPHYNNMRRDRVFLASPQAAQAAALSLVEPTPGNGKGKVVIEAFPGPGVLSRALLELPSSNLRKLIILEDDELYLKYLQPLQEADPRVTVVPMSGHSWDTYAHLEEQGLLKDVEHTAWEGPIPDLHFVAQLTQSVKGEQLIAQLFRCIPERSWLFQYGRVPMSIMVSDWVWSRLSAPPKSTTRCKLSVIQEATADSKEVVDPSLLAPYENYFYPPPTLGKGAPSRKAGQPMHFVTAVPYPEQVIQRGQTDQWDYCLRRLFVLKSTPLKDALNSLAPGASTLLKPLTDRGHSRHARVNVSKPIRDLNVADWAHLLRVFDAWPFKPSELLITDAFMHDE